MSESIPAKCYPIKPKSKETGDEKRRHKVRKPLQLAPFRNYPYVQKQRREAKLSKHQIKNTSITLNSIDLAENNDELKQPQSLDDYKTKNKFLGKNHRLQNNKSSKGSKCSLKTQVPAPRLSTKTSSSSNLLEADLITRNLTSKTPAMRLSRNQIFHQNYFTRKSDTSRGLYPMRTSDFPLRETKDETKSQQEYRQEFQELIEMSQKKQSDSRRKKRKNPNRKVSGPVKSMVVSFVNPNPGKQVSSDTSTPPTPGDDFKPKKKVAGRMKRKAPMPHAHKSNKLQQKSHLN